MKRLFSAVLAATIFFTPAVFLTTSLANSTTVEAKAVGGAMRSAPKVNLKKSPAPAAKGSVANEGSKSVSGSGAQGSYQPSKSARDLNRTAPTSPQMNTGSRWGNTLRNIGLFAGGMFLGSMLASMFGFGGLFGDILGLLANVAIFGLVVFAAMYLWKKFKSPAQTQNPVVNNFESQKQLQTFDQPRNDKIGMDYDPKRTADFYRNR